MKNKGLSYKSEKSGKIIPSRRNVGPRCKCSRTSRKGNKCFEFSEDDRRELLNNYYDLSSSDTKRQYIYKHTDIKKIDSPIGRTNKTFSYFLTQNNETKKVCKQFFLKTLNIGEKVIYTVWKNVNPTGNLESEKRGGRVNSLKQKDILMDDRISEHIDRFPYVESHYIRKDSSKKYLSPELTVRKMHDMYSEQEKTLNLPIASFSKYYSVFKSKNLSFHKPKKDQCPICESFTKSSDDGKEVLRHEYEKHVEEKQNTRKLKEESKSRSITDRKFSSACFDLEQVIYLPQTNRSEIFYKRRLSNYNFTVYHLATKEVHCFVWHEGEAKRGANEVATALFIWLKGEDKKGVTHVQFFADGCSGQNKNSIIPTMFRHFLESSESIKEIELIILVPNHGQTEGDSVHACVERALKRAGDVQTPSQLLPIIRLSRKSPYIVHPLEYSDFLDWKKLSVDIGILRNRTSDSNETINWTKMSLFRLKKEEKEKLYFKTSHATDSNLDSLTLRHKRLDVNKIAISRAYTERNKISQAKYEDLKSLRTGSKAIINRVEDILFYTNLAH